MAYELSVYQIQVAHWAGDTWSRWRDYFHKDEAVRAAVLLSMEKLGTKKRFHAVRVVKVVTDEVWTSGAD